eukprot:Nk52_evm8s268 gene=Nk52_evmTU8s268
MVRHSDFKLDKDSRLDTVEFVPGNMRNVTKGSKMSKEEAANPELLKELKTAEIQLAESKPKMTFALLLAAFTSMWGSCVAIGYHISAINNPKDAIVADFKNSHGIDYDSFWWSATVSIYCLGGLIGGLFGGIPTNFIGRKWTIVINSFVFIGGSLLQGFATAIWMMCVGRFLVGLASGLSTVAVPMYLNEISPLRFKGTMGVLTQMGIVVGILIANIFGMKEVFGTESEWQYVFFIACVFPVVCLIVMPLMPRSPTFSMAKGDREGAYSAMKKFRSEENFINLELDNLQAEIDFNSQSEGGGIKDIWNNKALRLAFIIALAMQALQQLSGINAVMYYSTSIFQDANVNNASMSTVLVGGINLLATILAILIIERTGRKPLLVYGFFFQGCLAVVLCVFLILKSETWANYLSIVTVLLYVVMFAVGPGPIPWLIVSDFFGSNVRDTAQSYCVFLNWTCNFIVGLAYPSIQSGLGDYNFLPFGVICILGAAFLFKTLPETKGRTNDQVLSAILQKNGIRNIDIETSH